jgi:thiol-disulfide isomerase/thioredoxin
MRTRSGLAGVCFLLAVFASVIEAADRTPTGLWDATVVVEGVDVPFRFEISRSGSTWRGAFFDGDLKVVSTRGRYENGALVLRFDEYGSTVDVVYKDDRLEGKYDRGTRGVGYPFRAVRAAPRTTSSRPVPSIAGEWRIPLETGSSKSESAWRFVVRQSGARVSAAIMRVDGDTGTLSGTFKDGRITLGHFAGAGPTVLEVTPLADGSLQLVLDGRTRLTAVRVTDPRAKSIPDVTDPAKYTAVKDPSAKFTFSFPDLGGKIMSDTDARFQGRVVIVSITGTWCPNCHDEAPFLSRLYKNYRRKGLEIVALSFEEPAQLNDLSRVRAFIKQYDITYPFLIAGEPEQAPQKLPQAVNLNTFPATFLLGKDGRVRATRAGYASKATGEFYDREQKQFLAEIDRLLAER